VGNVTDKSSDEIAEIEATQAALKESIQATKDLADKAEHLLQRHKRNMERDAESASQAA
jgi:ABC-type transporter Mla subunit MlaD